MEEFEFGIDDIVTIDRYNHIDDVQRGVIVGHQRALLSPRIDYLVRLSDVVIKTSGISIMESKYYEPVVDELRHTKK